MGVTGELARFCSEISVERLPTAVVERARFLVLDLVGNSVLRDSLRIVRSRGRVCQLGFLGGLEPVDGFDPITDLPTGVQLSFYGSAFVLGTPGFPLADIPLQQLLDKAANGLYQAKPVRVFGFGQIVEAHRAMEDGAAAGKMVVSVS